MLWRHGVLPSNNARNSPLLGRGKFRFKCSFMCVKHWSDDLKSVMLSSLRNWKTSLSSGHLSLPHTLLTHFEFISFKSAAANALTTAFMADSSGLLISSWSFCDIIFGFLPILFNLKTRNGLVNLPPYEMTFDIEKTPTVRLQRFPLFCALVDTGPVRNWNGPHLTKINCNKFPHAHWPRAVHWSASKFPRNKTHPTMRLPPENAMRPYEFQCWTR